ncbi:MAG: hypothetical protein GY898_01325 [Proteobacteria bacterium]|nr:hypothetical protein [Pseudomonadota bacterium]
MAEVYTSDPPAPGDRTRWLLLGIIAVGGALRLWNLGVWPGFSGDEGHEVFYSWQIAETGTFQLHPVRPYFGPWQLWITAPFLKVLGTTAAASRLPMALLGIATIPVAGAIGGRLGGSRASLAAAALVAVAPITVLFSRVALSVAALPVLILGTWWAWQRLIDKPEVRTAALAGLLLGAAVSFHPQAMALGFGLVAALAVIRGRARELLRPDLIGAAAVGFAALGWVSWDVIVDQIGLGPGIDYSGTYVDAVAATPLGTRMLVAGPTSTVDVLAGGRLLHWFAGPSSADPPGELLAWAMVVVAFIAAAARSVKEANAAARSLAIAIAAVWLLTVLRSADFDLRELTRERYLLTTLVLALPWLAWGLVGDGRGRFDRAGAALLGLLVVLQGTALGVGFFGAMSTTGGDAEPSFVASRPVDAKEAAGRWMLERLGADEEGLLLAGDSWSYWPVIAVTGERFPSDYVPERPSDCSEILRTRDHRRRWLMDFAGWHWNDEIQACLAGAGRPGMPPTLVLKAEDGRPLLLIWELAPGALGGSG